MELKKIKLKKLLSDLPVKIIGNKELEVSGLSEHSKMVSPGHLFIAKEGLTHHGSKFTEEAIHGGARAVLTDLYDPFCKEITQIICKSPADLEGEIAQRFFQYPAKELFMIGITGTNGKTTTAYLTRAILGEERCGLIGTIEYLIGSNSIPASYAPLDVISNHKMLARMKEQKLSHCVMEVTSHAIDQKRVDRIPFDIAVFTNLSREHLDYHKTLEHYISTKAKHFENLSKDKIALINGDSPYADAMIEHCSARVKTYGLSESAYYQADNLLLKPNGSSFDLTFDGKKIFVETNLVGKFNIYNTLSAIAIGLESQIDIETILERLKVFQPPRGRLERIEHEGNFQIFVDFAHTEDALENVLTTLKQVKHQKIITVFGCGGDRDQEKRPVMGKIVSQHSDYTLITSDNPRSEDPSEICRAIEFGCLKEKQVLVEVDRRDAIEKALALAEDGDILLIAGRGHEMHQIIGHKRIPFNDAEVVKELLGKDLART